MTVAMYARRKGWPLKRVTVRLRHSRVHAEDCAACDTHDAKLTVIDRKSYRRIAGDDQRARLLAIANRCPVHLTLASKKRSGHQAAMTKGEVLHFAAGMAS